MKRPDRPLRLVLDARLDPGTLGGVEQTVIGLAHGLAQLTDGDEEYLFFVNSPKSEWIQPYLRGRCRLLEGPPRSQGSWWKKACRTNSLARFALQTLSVHAGYRLVAIPRSDGTLERANVDVMDFTLPSGFQTDVPSIYTLQDLQHLHLPQFFCARSRLARDKLYQFFCKQARVVLTPSSWSRRDVIQQYRLPPEKVFVLPHAPVSEVYPAPSPEDIQRVKAKFCLPDPFLFFPAQTWAHKNHLALVEALRHLRQNEHVPVHLVCAGKLDPQWYPRIEARILETGLSGQVSFLGFVPPNEVRCLYSLCRAVVFPSLFEGFGMPIVEAFQTGTPVACSNATCLPSLAGNAALIFEPNNPEKIAEAIHRVWMDAGLRAELIERGRIRRRDFCWKRSARLLRAHFRRVAGQDLSNSDQELLATTPVV